MRKMKPEFDPDRTYAKKSLGQNFLMHKQIAERIVHAAGVHDPDVVLEIGPGTGLLTRALLDKAQKVIAVEADHELIAPLQEKFSDELSSGKLVLIESDIRSFDTATIKTPYKIVANIPYYITGEIIRQFLTASHKPLSMTILVQKEVAERIARSKKESLLSLSVKVFGTPKYEFTVPKGAFMPAPKVDSAVLSISSITSPFPSNAQEAIFFNVLHAAFAHKRKQLTKNLEGIIPVSVTKEILEKAGLPVTIRAEDVPMTIWHELVKTVR